MLSCGTFLLGICLCLVHHGLQWRTCVVTALPVEILEVGQELIAATPIDPFPSDLTEAIHSLSHCSSRPNAPLPFVLYVLFDAQCSSECLRTLSAAWGQECMPAPTAVYVVNAMRYSTPLTDVGQFKTHAAALTHFLLILQEDSFSDPTVMMVVDLTEHCLSLASLSARSTLTDTLALALFPTVTPLYFASLSSSYITTGPFIKLTLLEHVLIGSTLLEYTLPDTDTTVNALRSHLLSLNPPTTRAALTKGSPLPPPCRLPPSLSSLSRHWTHKTIFLISLGDQYTRSIDWSRLTAVLSDMNPLVKGYSVRVYGDKEVVQFLQQNFPSFLAFYQSPLLRYTQWRSDFIRYLLLYTFGGVYIDLDHKLVSSLDAMLDSIGSGSEYRDKNSGSDSFPRHIFVRSITAGCIHNGFIMTNTVGDELFLALAGKIFLTTEEESWDYGKNTRDLFELLQELHGPLLQGVGSQHISPEDGLSRRRSDVYLLQEVKLSSHPDDWCNATAACKYAVTLDAPESFASVSDRSSESRSRGRVVMFSNGLPNWPPRVGQQLFVSS